MCEGLICVCVHAHIYTICICACIHMHQCASVCMCIKSSNRPNTDKGKLSNRKLFFLTINYIFFFHKVCETKFNLLWLMVHQNSDDHLYHTIRHEAHVSDDRPVNQLPCLIYPPGLQVSVTLSLFNGNVWHLVLSNN